MSDPRGPQDVPLRFSALWTCETCGAMFPRLADDEDVKRCSNCVEIERLTNKLDTDSQQFELECRKAQIARLEQRHDTACHLMHRLCDWFYRRTDDAEDAAFIDAERFLSEHAPKRREK